MEKKKLESLRHSVRLHLNWFVRAVAGDEALSSAELKELNSFKALPTKSLDFVKKSFFLGRLNAVLKKKEYKDLSLANLEKSMKLAKLSKLEKLAVIEAQQSAGTYLRSFASEIEDGIFSRVAATDGKLVTEATIQGIIKDEVAFALLQNKTWEALAESLASELNTKLSKKIERIARTEMHGAKQRGIVQAIANKVDIYQHSDGSDSKVSVVTEAGCCSDCSKLYSEADGTPKIFKLSELLKNGTNADKQHTRTNGLHTHWLPVVPPAHPHCFPAGTEILTKNNGWRAIEKLELDEPVLSLDPITKNLEYVPVKYTVESYSDTLLEFSSNNFSLTCTPNHNLVVMTDWQSKNNKKLQSIPASEVSKSSYLYRSSEWTGNDSNFDMFGFTPEQFCEFMGYFLSEGSLHPNEGQIDISQFKTTSKQIMLEALSSMPFQTVSSVKIGIYLKHKDLWKYLKQFGTSHEKYVPNEIKELSSSCINIFLDAFALGDGHRRIPKEWKNAKFREELVFFTSSEKLASDIGELLVKTGHVPSYHYDSPSTVTHHNGTYTSKHGLWRIRRCYNKQAAVSHMTVIEKPHYDLVYCVELEKFNTLYVRQNGKCTWAGNCFCTLRYVPPGYGWEGRRLVLVNVEELQKAFGDSAVSATVKPKGPPQGVKTPTPGHVPGVASPGKGGATTVKPPTSDGASAGTGIEYEYWTDQGAPPSDGGWEGYQKRDGGSGFRRPKGSGGQPATPEEEQAHKQAQIAECIMWGKQQHPIEEHIRNLEKANIIDIRQLGDGESGATDSFLVALEGGGRALMKPPAWTTGTKVEEAEEGWLTTEGARSVPHGTAHKREAAAFDAYQSLGLTDFVPPTSIRNHEGQAMSMQSWAEGYKPIISSFDNENSSLRKAFTAKFGKDTKPENAVKHLLELVPESKQEQLLEKLSDGAVAAIAFNHNDQHMDNVIINDDWDIKFIDNSMAFGNGMDGCKNQIHRDLHRAGRKLKISDKLLQKFDSTSLGDLKRSLGGNLEDWAVGQTYLRMKYLSHLQKTEGHLDFEKFRPVIGPGNEALDNIAFPRSGFWTGSDKDISKEFERRKKAGLLQNQLFESFSKQWINDALAGPDGENKSSAQELSKLGVFMGPGHAVDKNHRRDKKHIKHEATIKPGYPPKDIKMATSVVTEEPKSKDIPKTQVSNKAPHKPFDIPQTRDSDKPAYQGARSPDAFGDANKTIAPKRRQPVADDPDRTKKSLYISLDRYGRK